MAKRLSLQDIVISNPKAVSKPTINDDALTCILPKYYNSVADINIHINSDNSYCWFCNQLLLVTPFHVETMKGKYVGNFCSKICRDSFATMIKSHVALREEPKITLLPLVFYDKPDEIINIINLLKNKEGIYGNCFYKENDQTVHISLRSLL
ncbi:late transcription factor VLTF-2 [Deerpox virus W-1170-84]|uniref:Viral late gene transcription factor 2 n=2 Tax=Mule deerpox virus TaxID=304399 RepID=Q08FQ2_DPV83|nr:Late transcription factor VLTF-2 [Deerpox virus W-848-83]ABI99084.1 late transcription factor VLTF-2 [Deerpox virus W-1170-84]ABI99255.1 late transcription factor VLTF-2 [Deerpox virus W-848-83]AYC44774.1 late transcription factor VLTF-2 [Moosepox virus GoldyGopher14]